MQIFKANGVTYVDGVNCNLASSTKHVVGEQYKPVHKQLALKEKEKTTTRSFELYGEICLRQPSRLL